MWQLLRFNFVAAVWLCIGSNLFQFWRHTSHAQQLNMQFGPWSPTVGLAPLLIASGQLFLWFRFYRFGGSAARVAAACAGGVLALIVLVQLLRGSIDIPISDSGTWLYVYFTASHLAYTLLGRYAERGAA